MSTTGISMNPPNSNPLSKCIVGENDVDGCKILCVYYTSSDCSIYLRKGRKLFCHKEVRLDGDELVKSKISTIQAQLDKIGSLVTFSKRDEAFITERQVAALKASVMGNHAEAAAILEQASENHIKRVSNSYRQWYKMCSFASMILVVTACVLLSNIIKSLLGQLDSTLFFGACVGSFVYASIQIDKVEINPDTGRVTLFFHCLTSMLFAIVSSLIINAAIEANIVFGMLKGTAQPYIFLAGAVAGYGQNTITKVFLHLSPEK